MCFVKSCVALWLQKWFNTYIVIYLLLLNMLRTIGVAKYQHRQIPKDYIRIHVNFKVSLSLAILTNWIQHICLTINLRVNI